MGKAVWKREQGVCPQLDCLWSGRGRAGGDWGLRTGRHGREDIRKERQRGRPARGGERRGERSIIIGSFHAEPRAEGAFVPLELSSLHVIARERCQCTYDRKRPWTPCPITDPPVFWGATTRRSLAPVSSRRAAVQQPAHPCSARANSPKLVLLHASIFHSLALISAQYIPATTYISHLGQLAVYAAPRRVCRYLERRPARRRYVHA